MITIRSVVEVMNFSIKINDIDKNEKPFGQPITVMLHFKDKCVPVYCEYHTTDLKWLTCNSLWFLVSSAIMIETKPKQIFKTHDIKHKINHYEFFKNKSNTLKELVGEEIYTYLVNNVDVSQRY